MGFSHKTCFSAFNAWMATAVELEEKLGFSRNSLYSRKRNKPSVEKLQKVADYFHVSTDYLLGRESQGRQNIDITPAITNTAHYSFI